MSPRSGRFRWLALGAAITLVVGACTSTPASPGAASAGASTAASAPAAGSPDASTITGTSCAANATVVKFWTSSTPPDSDSQKKIVEAFNAANPDICVKMTLTPSTGSETNVTKLQASIRGGVAPDVYRLDRFTTAERASQGVVAELPADVDALKDQYVDFAWAETQWKGHTYSIPFETDVRALWYNKDLITAAGEDPAQLDISKGPPTIELVNKIADKITKKDASGNYTIMGWMPGGPGPGGNPGAFDQGWHYTWGYINNGSFADLAACKVTPTDPGVVAGYQFLYDWHKDRNPQAISRWVASNLQPNAATATNPFWTGKLGMTISGDWRISEQLKYVPNGHYAFTYIPVAKAGDPGASWAGGWSMALIPGSKAKDQAVKFMKYMAGPEGQKVYTKETAHLPTLKALLTDDSLYDASHKVFLKLFSTAKTRPPLPVGALYWDQLTSAMGSVELNSKQPMEALQAVEAAVQPKLTTAGC